MADRKYLFVYSDVSRRPERIDAPDLDYVPHRWTEEACLIVDLGTGKVVEISGRLGNMAADQRFGPTGRSATTMTADADKASAALPSCPVCHRPCEPASATTWQCRRCGMDWSAAHFEVDVPPAPEVPADEPREWTLTVSKVMATSRPNSPSAFVTVTAGGGTGDGVELTYSDLLWKAPRVGDTLKVVVRVQRDLDELAAKGAAKLAAIRQFASASSRMAKSIREHRE